MDQGAWGGYSPWGRKELDTTERVHFHFQAYNVLVSGVQKSD